MSKKYKFQEETGLHFITATTVGWVDLFTRQHNRDILIDCLKWCQEHKGLHICAYVIMTNHIHMVAYTDREPLSKVMQSFKKFTAARLLEVVNERPESRKEWLLRLLKWFGNQKGQAHQVWEWENHPISLWTAEVVCQKIRYLHQNPVRAGYVAEPEHWLYSSASTYAGIGVPLLQVEILDLWGVGS
jgi:REP element-mobilizing transposase RayT